jgi:Ca2+-binding EF-hand superfamily protein
MSSMDVINPTQQELKSFKKTSQIEEVAESEAQEQFSAELHRDSGFDVEVESEVKERKGSFSEPTKEYKVTILSGNVSTEVGGSDNKFYLTLIGDKGESEKHNIVFEDKESESVQNLMKHKFPLEAKDVGIVKTVRVTHINEDNGLYRWHLGSVKVGHDDKKTTFRFNQWVEQHSGEFIIEITAKPKSIVDNHATWFTHDGQTDGEHGMTTLRSIKHMKRNTEVDSEAYKVLLRAEEIYNSEEFCAKKEKSREYLLEVNLMDDYFNQRMEELALDMAEREDERNRRGDCMEFERAGLSEEEQAKVRKLDETNNPCYAYLRAHGNMWQYDPAEYPPRYKARLYRRFDTFDKDHDGAMSINEVLQWADRMRFICFTDDSEIERVRTALDTYFTMYGLRNPGGLCRENWVEAHIAMTEATLERHRQNDPIPMKFMAASYFDVIDEDDNGTVDMEELKNMMNIFRVPEEAAYPFFEFADKDRNGVLEVDEMHQLFYRFWFTDYMNEELDGVFGYKY